VPAGRLDANHLGAEPGQQPRRQRSHIRRQIEDAKGAQSGYWREIHLAFDPAGDYASCQTAFAKIKAMAKLGGFLLAIGVLISGAWLAYSMLTARLPSVDNLPAIVHGRLASRNAAYTHLDEIPITLQESTIVVEDVRFMSNTGIDPRGAFRAVVDDVIRRCFCEGGSTITQQLAKQIYLEGDDASPQRKLDTILLAFEIDRAYSKADILEYYLNTAYYGHGAYGVGTASTTYWRQPLSRLTLAEAAMLAGLPQAPSDYDPILHPESARARRRVVLDRLREFGLINDAQLQSALAQPVAATAPQGTIDRNNPS
jgi:penicillin-binding protein 1A